ncbi:MAG: hypothetical protein CBC11_012160 [Proteobacteria bacterium TMED51]|nr:MAG: hypothetical protein CBC11_012160 [Proteobacteria bacterium TMED51]
MADVKHQHEEMFPAAPLCTGHVFAKKTKMLMRQGEKARRSMRRRYQAAWESAACRGQVFILTNPLLTSFFRTSLPMVQDSQSSHNSLRTDVDRNLPKIWSATSISLAIGAELAGSGQKLIVFSG